MKLGHERGSDRDVMEGCNALLRLSLDTLDELWRRRLHDRWGRGAGCLPVRGIGSTTSSSRLHLSW